MSDRHAIEQAITALEGQRSVLGNAIVETSIAALQAQLATIPPSPIQPQRKHATILFADISGFTALSETLDAEDVSGLMNDLWEHLDAVVFEHGGHIDKHIGDALMAIWGVETAYEDDPVRAVRAALAMQQALADFRDRRSLELAMRVGLNTGPVLLDTVGSTREFTAMGDTVNVASRLEHAAPINGVLISHSTFRQIHGLFDARPQALLTVKGKALPIQTYIVTGTTPHASRLPTRGVEGITTKTVGRQAELQLLQRDYLDMIEAGAAHSVMVVGEAGMGKSRLLREFELWLNRHPTVPLSLRGRATLESANHPGELLRDVLRQFAGIQENDDRALVQQKLDAALTPAMGQDQAALLSQAAGFDFSTAPAVMAASADGFSALAAAGLAALLRALTEEAPLVILLEDLHWADDVSLDLLGRALAQQPNQRILVVALARPALFVRQTSWSDSQLRHLRIDLTPLTPEESRALASEILQRVDDIPGDLLTLIVQRAEGNPFYIEELIKMLIDTGVISRSATDSAPWVVQMAQLANLAIPQTLTGVLQSRLDTLPPREKQILQRASVVGRAFWDSAIVAIDPQALTLADIHASLNALVTRELIFQRDRSSFAEAREYYFKHALLREVTYESVLKRLRRQYHRQVASWIAMASEARVDEYAALIADHYEQAEEDSEIGSWQLRAGRWALAQHANDEALRRLSRALLLIPLTDHAARYSALAAREHLHDMRGEWDIGADDLRELTSLADTLADRRQQVDIAIRWSSHYHKKDVIIDAETAARRALEFAQGEPSLEISARIQMGLVLGQQANYEAASDYLLTAMDLARQIGDLQREMEALSQLAWVRSGQGEYHAARNATEQVLKTAQALGDHNSEAAELYVLGIILTSQGEHQLARTYLEPALVLCRQLSQRWHEAWVLAALGLGAACLGDHQRAYDQAERSVTLMRDMGDEGGAAYALRGITMAALQQGDLTRAHACCVEALSTMRSLNERHVQLWSLHSVGQALQALGHVLLELGQIDAAADAFREASQSPTLKYTALVVEAHAGMGAALLAQQNLAAAVTEVEHVLAHLSTGTLEGALAPLRIYRDCHRVLHASSDPRATPLLSRAYAELMSQSAPMDEAVQRQFLEAVPWNREISQLWRSQQEGSSFEQGASMS